MDKLLSTVAFPERVETLRRRTGEFVRWKPRAGHPWRDRLHELLCSIRREGWTAYLFGGTARELLKHGGRIVPRDIDLVFYNEHFDAFRRRHREYVRSTNRFGGLRLKVGHIDLDVWPVEGTWAFGVDKNLQPSFENLPKTTFLNIDALAVELFPRPGKARRIYDAGCFEACQSRLLDINFVENPVPELCVVRALYCAHKFEFGVSSKLRRYLVNMMGHYDLPSFVEAQSRHYRQVWFNEKALRQLLDTMRRGEAGDLCNEELFGRFYHQGIFPTETDADFTL